MQLSFKLLPCIFFTGVVSVFGLTANTEIINEYFPNTALVKSIFDSNETPSKNQKRNSTIQDNLSTSTKSTTLSNKTISETNIEDANKFFVDNIPTSKKFSPTLIRITGIDGTGGPSDDVAGIDGTGGPSGDIAGIDGTGGPSGDVAGIDGTGGPSSEDITGIDGTGGPKSETPHTVAKVTLATLGTLQRQGNRLIVNGIAFQATDETKTIIDGNTESNTSTLSSGQVVLINGNVDEQNNGIAKEIIYTTQISGAITNISNNSITVLQQTIVLHDEIIFGGSATKFADLEIGDIVNVSGFNLSNGELSATRIDRIVHSNTNDTDKVTGAISGLNDLTKTFTINDLVINYSQIAELPVLKNGMIVNVRGEVNNQKEPVLNASSITTSTSIVDNNKVEKVEIEGFITEFIDASNFKIGDIAISTNLQTDFIGNDWDDLALNIRIEVEGEIERNPDGNNTLKANKVLFLVANLTSHTVTGVSRIDFSSATETFTWNNVNAKAYRLRIGNYYDETFDDKTTSVTISGLPENGAFSYVYLYTLQGDFWHRKLYHAFGSKTLKNAELTRYNNGDVLESTTETFTWSAVPGAEAYRLRIFDYHTNKDISPEFPETVFTEPEPVTLSNLPTNGADINVHLQTKHNGWWSGHHYNLKSIQLQENATLTSHSNWQQLTNHTETFTWKDVGAEQYEIRVARRDIKNWYDFIMKPTVIDGSITSITIDNLPVNSGQVEVRLRTKHTHWASEYYTFIGSSTTPSAKLSSHENKEVLSSTTTTFTWDKILDAEEYNLRITNPVIDGTPRFEEDYDNNHDGDSTVISQTITNLPSNSAQVIVTLSTKHNGYWSHKQYQLYGNGDELEDAQITSHTDWEKVNTSSITVTWNDVNADAYYLIVQNLSLPGHPRIHIQPYDANTHSAILDNLPNNSQIYIGVQTKHGNWWASKGINIFTDIPE